MRGFGVDVERSIKAAPEVVFPYFTDPEKYRRWKGLDAELDARPGGIYRVVVAPGAWIVGEYVEVDPPNRLVATWGWKGDAELPPGVGEVLPGSTRVEITFAAIDEGTLIRVRHTSLPNAAARSAHAMGWGTYLNRLASIVEGVEPVPDPLPGLIESFRTAATQGHITQ